MWLVSFTPRLFCPRRKIIRYAIGGEVDFRATLGRRQSNPDSSALSPVDQSLCYLNNSGSLCMSNNSNCESLNFHVVTTAKILHVWTQMSLIRISRRNEISLMCIENYALFPLPLSRVNRLFISVIEPGVTLTSSFGNMFISIVVALYRFIPKQRREISAGFTHYYTWSRIWVWAAGPSFRTIGTVASPGVTWLASWRSMGFPSSSTLVWCPILTTLRWTSFTWVTCLPDTLHKIKFEVLTLDCDAV